MISIISAYYNRRGLFYQTLKSITKSKYKDIEYIVVDDGSDPQERLEDLVGEFPFLKIKYLEKANKWYTNPCIPFNIGIREAKGDIIVLQNPECLYVHDVLAYINENINDSKYISISAYGLNPILTTQLPYYCSNDTLIDFFNTLPQEPYRGWDTLGWYNHSVFRPVYFHFCSAMTRGNMEKLNGFDERFATGVAYDDDELVARIRIMGLTPIIEDKVSVIHQYHPSVWIHPNNSQLCEKNRLILVNYTLKENKYRANQASLWE